MTNYHDLTALTNLGVMLTLGLSDQSKCEVGNREPKKSVHLAVMLSGCSSCSVQLSRKPKFSLNLWQKSELSLNLL